MAAFEITHSARNGSNTTGSVWVERTGKVYTFLAFPNGNVMLARGNHPVAANHLRDVRLFVSKRFAVASAAPARVPQPVQQQQAQAAPRRAVLALAAGLLAATAAPALAADTARRGDDTARLPDHTALWARMPLPFTPAEAWRLLSPATQAEIGAAVIGMHLAQYVHGDSMAEADCFLDDGLREQASDVAHDILNRMDDRLWTLFPDLYGPDGDHPRWALDSGMVHPLGTVLPERPQPSPAPEPEPDPILPALAAVRAAEHRDRATLAAWAGDESAKAEAECDAAAADRDAVTAAMRATLPTTLAGAVALAEYHAADMADADGGDALAHLAEALAGIPSSRESCIPQCRH